MALDRATFDHIGIVTDERHDGEVWVEPTRVWVTNPRLSSHNVEWLRFEPDTPVTGPLRTEPHVAYRVADVDGRSRATRCSGPVRGRRRVLPRRLRDGRRGHRGVHAVRESGRGGMVLMRVGGHSNTYHTRSAEEAWAGIAAAGYRTVELSSVIGWTEHVDLDADPAELYARLAHYGLEPTVLSAHSDLTTDDGVEYALKAIGWAATQRHPGDEHRDRRALLAGGGRVGVPARHRARARPRPTTRGVDVALEIHGDIMATGALTLPLLERIGHPRIKVAYDTANCEFYGDTKAVDDLHTCCRTSRTSTSRTSAAARASGTSRSPAPGTSTSPPSCGILSDGGYDGPASVEIEFDGTWPDAGRHRHGHEGRARPSRGQRLRLQRRAMIGIAILGAGFMGQTHAGAWKALGRPGPGRGGRVAYGRSRGGGRGDGGIGRCRRRPAGGDRRPARRLVDIACRPRCTAARPRPRSRPASTCCSRSRLALTREDAEAILGAAERSGRTLLVGLVLRHWPEYQRLHELAAEGEIGTVAGVHAAAVAAGRLGRLVHRPVPVRRRRRRPDGARLRPAERAARPGSDRPRAVRAEGPHGAPQHVVAVTSHPGGPGFAEGGMMLPGSYPFTSDLRVLGDAGMLEYPFAAGPAVDGGNIGGVDQEATGCGCTRPTARRRWSTSRAPIRGTGRRRTWPTASRPAGRRRSARESRRWPPCARRSRRTARWKQETSRRSEHGNGIRLR